MLGTAKRLGEIGLRAGALGLLMGGGYVVNTWRRYGHIDETLPDDLPLDRFIMHPEVREQHDIRVRAPADVTYRAALALNIHDSSIIRSIFRGRELLLGSAHRAAPPLETPFLEQMIALGWSVLAEEPGREIVLGAITRPWEPNPRFEPIPAADFSTFSHPRSVKIAWSVSALEAAHGESIFRTETRVVTTDAEARRRFRRYWALVVPGVRMIRRETLRLVKTAAEDAARRARTSGRTALPHTV